MKIEIPSLQKRLPALIEHIWNTRENISCNEFMANIEKTDMRLSVLINDDRQDDLLIDHNFSQAEDGN